MGAFYLAVNRNKRSIVLDLKQEAARRVLLRLAEGADVLLHNYRPQAARRLGMSYEAFRAVNPGIVYVGTYGFRAAGPYGEKPAYDDIIQAASGLASTQASLMGEPRYVPTIVADKTSSMTVLAAVLAALYHKARTGEGQEVEVPMFESMAAWVMVEHLYGETFVPPRDTIGYKRILNPYRRPFKTRDGYLAILPYTDQNWRDFFILADRTDLLEDPRYKTLATRLKHIEQLYEELARIATSRTNAEWLAELDRRNIPAMSVNSLESLLHDPHLEAVGFWQIVEHPTEGTMRLPGIPATYGKTPGAIRRLPPRLGEHSVEILREVGIGDEEIEALLGSGATRSAS
jgi:crotonobetainyl-CoA:carnitine CoA-transferase CaiB-like acyl-CoA transferase